MFSRLQNTVIFATALATSAFLAVAIPASAATPDESPAAATRTVHTSDLNLPSPSGVKLLRHRIAVAARVVCAAVDDPTEDCVKAATETAWAQAATVVASKAGGTQFAAAATQH